MKEITNGEWKLSKDNKGIDIDGKLCITCWQVGKVDQTRLNGESWLEMMDRTKAEREMKFETMPKENASFIMDAYNTANKCGLLPSELLKQRDELLEALKEVRQHMTAHIPENVFDLVDTTINNATLTNQ